MHTTRVRDVCPPNKKKMAPVCAECKHELHVEDAVSGAHAVVKVVGSDCWDSGGLRAPAATVARATQSTQNPLCRLSWSRSFSYGKEQRHQDW